MSALRIALLHRVASRFDGGIYFAQTGLLPHLGTIAGASAEFRVFAGSEGLAGTNHEEWRPATVEAFPMAGPRSFGFASGLGAALEAYDPHVLHVHGLWRYCGWIALRHHRRFGTPMIVSPHGMLDTGALRISPAKKAIAGALFQNAQLRRSAAVHCLNRAEAEAVRAYGIAAPCAIIPNGVELPSAAKVSSPPWTPNPARRRVLLFMGRIHPKKGLLPLLHAWGSFQAEGSVADSWRLVIAGWDEGQHTAELQKEVARLNLGESVEFTGPLWNESKQAALEHCEAFVLPSSSEGLPVAVLEAWSHCKPALLTAACNLPEGAAAGAAWEMQPSSESIAAALERMAKAPEAELQRMGNAGRMLVESRFTWSRIAAEMWQVYQALHRREPLPAHPAPA